MSFEIGFDTIVLLIATIIQSNRMHISAKIVLNLYKQMSQFTNIDSGKYVFFSLFLFHMFSFFLFHMFSFPYSLFLIPYSFFLIGAINIWH